MTLTSNSNYDWPNPRTRVQPERTWIQNHVLNTLKGQDKQFTAPGQWRVYDYPNPKATPRLSSYSWIQNLSLTTLNRPVGQTSSTFPVFTQRTPQTWVSNLLETVLGIITQPFKQTNWPLSFKPLSSSVFYSQNLLETTLKPITPPITVLTSGRQLTEKEVLSSWMKAIRRMVR